MKGAAVGQPSGMQVLNALAVAAAQFAEIIFVFSMIAALAVQGLHEALRFELNRWVFKQWLARREPSVDYDDFLREMESISSGALFSLPYWQVTGQINATLSTKIELAPDSPFVGTFANWGVSESTALPATGAALPAEGPKMDSAKLHDLVSRVQNGVQSLHSRLRSFWRKFDYVASFVVIAIMMVLVVELRGSYFELLGIHGALDLLLSIAIFASLATPLVRRIIERFVPLR
jgi:hypothetical protein